MSYFCMGAGALAVLGLLAPLSPSSAHVTLQTAQAAVDGRYQAVLRVPHGCDGSATVALRVRIPEGMIGVKPQPKAGWKLDVVRGDYARPYTLYKAQIASGVNEIAWTGNLPDAYYDEFVFVGYLSDTLKPGTALYFPVVQECEKGVKRWIDVPDTAGHTDSAHDTHEGSPAPALKLLPKD